MTDETKKIVDELRKSACKGCIHDKIGRCMHIQQGKFCGSERHKAADMIEKLSAQLVNQATEYSQALKITTEQRDAAVADLDMCCPCEACTRDCKYDKVNPYDECADFEWRGLPEPPKG